VEAAIAIEAFLGVAGGDGGEVIEGEAGVAILRDDGRVDDAAGRRGSRAMTVSRMSGMMAGTVMSKLPSCR
jgi:hypothetical protein